LSLCIFKEADKEISFPTPSPAIVVALLIAASGVLLMGILPSDFWEMAQEAHSYVMLIIPDSGDITSR